MYKSGTGCEQDAAEAARWLRRAAEQGVVQAQTDLAMMIYTGQGVVQDFQEAVAWLLKAAQNNDAMAQFSLGYMYRKGQGLPQSDTESIKWYRLAAEQGHHAAQNNLGFAYLNGLGTAQNLDEAMSWYHRAAVKGDADAQLSLTTLRKSERLWPMVASLSEADFSVLEAASNRPNSKMMTLKGSANYVLWSEMEKLGWLQSEGFAEKQPTALLTKAFGAMRTFTVTPEGERALNRLVTAFRKARA